VGGGRKKLTNVIETEESSHSKALLHRDSESHSKDRKGEKRSKEEKGGGGTTGDMNQKAGGFRRNAKTRVLRRPKGERQGHGISDPMERGNAWGTRPFSRGEKVTKKH